MDKDLITSQTTGSVIAAVLIVIWQFVTMGVWAIWVAIPFILAFVVYHAYFFLIVNSKSKVFKYKFLSTTSGHPTFLRIFLCANLIPSLILEYSMLQYLIIEDIRWPTNEYYIGISFLAFANFHAFIFWLFNWLQIRENP